MNCFIGIASKNSFPKKITLPDLILSKLFIQLILSPLKFFCCNFLSVGLFSYKKMLQEAKKDGNFLNTLIILKHIFPEPGPSSTILKSFGLPKCSQSEITQTAIISLNKNEISGAVIKSPFFPIGFFLA